MTVITIEDNETYQGLLKQNSAVLKLSAKWCGPCKVISPKYSQLSSLHTNTPFYEVDIDEFEDIANEHEIAGIPAFIVFRDGTVQSKHVGVNLSSLEKELTDITDANEKNLIEGVNALAINPTKSVDGGDNSQKTISTNPSASHTKSKNTLSDDDIAVASQITPIIILLFNAIQPTTETEINHTTFSSQLLNIIEKQKGNTSKMSLLQVDSSANPYLAEKYNISKKYPTVKILHKGIHFATIDDGDVALFEKKISELNTMF